jgi:hypothetical protein
VSRAAATIAALLAAALLQSCGGDEPKPAAPAAPPSGLAQLAAEAERWAMRGEALLNRGWAQRLQFRQRLYGRVQVLRAFAQEAAATATAAGPPPERLVERGRMLVNGAKPFDDALSLLERVAGTLDQLTGYERVIELGMTPLETRGEAPYRIRVTDFKKQVADGFSNLDLALRGIVDQAGDAKLFENIAAKGLSDALATATRLSEEVKLSGHASAKAVDRRKMLLDRLIWAQDVAARTGKDLPEAAAKALAEATKFAKDELDAGTDAVLESLRNAQPDAFAKSKALAEKVEPVIDSLTRAFLPISRSAGVPDPK